ncbi:MAG: nitrate/nitrite transporter [Nitrospira sp.]|nr:nitrate/nitrite transporter [Nitrospira sp.]
MKKLIAGIRSGHPGSLLAAFLYFDVSFMVWVLLGALGVLIAEDLRLSPSQKGLMVAIPLLSGAAMRILVGVLTDRFGAKRTGLWSLSVVLIPLGWGWWGAESFPELLGIGFLLGVAGASFAVALPLASRWYPPEHQGLAMGIAGAGNSGTVIAVLAAPRVAQLDGIGWHGVFGLAMLPVLAILIAFSYLAREVPPRLPQRAATVLREAALWWFCGFYAITFGGFVGLASFLGMFFHDQYGVGAVAAGTLTGLCVFAGSLIRPVGGLLADRAGGLRLLAVIYGLIAVLFGLVGLLPSLYPVVGLLFLGMLALGMGNGVIFQLVPQRFADQIGVVTGIVGAAGGVGGFFLPSILGILKDLSGSYGTGFLVFALLALGGLLVITAHQHRWALAWAQQVDQFPEDHPNRVRMEVVFGG